MSGRDAIGPIARLGRAYVRVVETLLVGGMLSVVVLATLQVFFRYALGASLSWSEEALRYLMVWITSLGVGLAYARGEMIGMELLLDAMPPRLARWLGLLGRLLVIALMAFVVIYGWRFAWQTRAASATALPVSMFWVHVSIAVGALLIGLHALTSTVATLREPAGTVR